MVHAEADGAVVVVGRCSQDEGAPPLWPWSAVLDGLGADLPTSEGDDTTPFAAWASIVGTVRDAAADRPLLVVLDDLHWADASSLRVLRLLAETVEAGRLLVVATWREEPAPTGALAEAAEMLARRHAVRVRLTGLGAAESARVVAAVGAHLPSPIEADDLHRRTDGNPFFLVEYARLARERGDLGVLLAEDGPPAAVTDVVARRVAALSGATARALRGASVAGRDFDLATLAVALGRPADKVLDDLDPALAAGLVREDGVDRFRFAHALVRDTVYAAMSRSRAARWHAVLAAAVSEQPGRESEEARHWLAAGPAYARAAWRACRRAATRAEQVFAYEEASALLTAAAQAIDDDPAATLEERCDLLTDQARALQLAGDWVRLRPVVHRAVAAATDLGDVPRVVRAAGVPLTGALWQSTYHADLDEPVVAALRLALDRLPEEDGEVRCRAMASLAAALYYDASPTERDDLARDSLAMARRLGDPALLLWCCLTMATTTWRAGNAEARLGMLDEALAAAEETGDRLAASSARTLRAVAYAELGRVAELEEAIASARAEAERLRHLYAQLVLDSLETPWLAMRGDLGAVDARIAHLAELSERMALPQGDETVASARMSRLMWSGGVTELVALLDRVAAVSPLPLAAVRAAMAGRAGQVDRIETLLAEPLDLDSDTWFSPVAWATTAEAALYVGRADLAATAYDRLSRRGGRTVSTGSGAMLGPTEAFLALAAAATGDRSRAARHADEALALCWAWRIPLVADWLTDLRARFDF